MKTTRITRPFIDTAGRHCSTVTLAGNAGEAIVLTEDLDALAALGVSGNWVLNANGAGSSCYVRGWRRGGNTVSIARILTGALPSQIVTHKDGDRLNLRRDNLLIQPRARRGRDVALDEAHAEQFARDCQPSAAQAAHA